MKRDDCTASEFAEMVERSAAKLRAACRKTPGLTLEVLMVRFESELQRELERRAAAHDAGAAARRV